MKSETKTPIADMVLSEFELNSVPRAELVEALKTNLNAVAGDRLPPFGLMHAAKLALANAELAIANGNTQDEAVAWALIGQGYTDLILASAELSKARANDEMDTLPDDANLLS